MSSMHIESMQMNLKLLFSRSRHGPFIWYTDLLEFLSLCDGVFLRSLVGFGRTEDGMGCRCWCPSRSYALRYPCIFLWQENARVLEQSSLLESSRDPALVCRRSYDSIYL